MTEQPCVLYPEKSYFKNKDKIKHFHITLNCKNSSLYCNISQRESFRLKEDNTMGNLALLREMKRDNGHGKCKISLWYYIYYIYVNIIYVTTTQKMGQ